MSVGCTFSEVRTSSGMMPHVLSFDLHTLPLHIASPDNSRPSVAIFVTRTALDDHAAREGIEIGQLAGGYVEMLQTYQPEFAKAAFEKVWRRGEPIIDRGDPIP